METGKRQDSSTERVWKSLSYEVSIPRLATLLRNQRKWRQSEKRSPLHQRACATPACVPEEKRQRVIVRREAFVIGPVNEHRPADYQIARHITPEATVLTVVPVITHHKITVRGHHDLFAVALVYEDIVRRIGLVGIIVDVVCLAWLARGVILNFYGALIVMVYSFDAMLRQNFSVNNDVAAFDLNVIARQPDHALYIVSDDRLIVGAVIVALRIVLIPRVLENNDVTAANLPLRQERRRGTRCEDEFVDQQVI